MNNSIDEAWERFLEEPEEQSFQPVFEKSHEIVWSICIRILRSPEEAEDAYQRVWARLLAASREQRVHLQKAGMVETMRKLSILEADRLRKRRSRRNKKEILVEEIPHVPDGGARPDTQAAERELITKIETLIQTLPEKYRIPLLMYYFNGLSHREIGEALGRPARTIGTQVSRGVKKLSKLMKKAGLGEVTPVLALLGHSYISTPVPAAVSSAESVYTLASKSVSEYNGLGVTLLMAEKSKLAVLHIAATAAVILAIAIPIVSNTLAKEASASNESTELIIENTVQEEVDPVTPGESESTHGHDTEGRDREMTSQVNESEQLEVRTDEKITPGTSVAYGTVYYPDGTTPFEGAEVRLIFFGEESFGDLTTTSSSDGSWEIRDLKTSTAFLAASSVLYRAFDREKPRILNLKSGERNGPFDIVMQDGHLLSVAVLSEETLEPVSGARVILEDGSEGRTNTEGVIHFGGLMPGEWQVQILAEGFAEMKKTANLVEDEGGIIEAHLKPGGTVYGYVTDNNGAPISDATYGVYASGPGFFIHFERTKPDGSYRVDYLPLGDSLRDITFKHPEFPTTSSPAFHIPSDTGEVQLDIIMSQGDFAEGLVVDMNGQPIQNAKIIYGYNTHHELKTRTGFNGEFRLDSLSSESWFDSVNISADGYAAQRFDGLKRGASSSPNHNRFQLHPGQWVGGTVTDTAGRALPEVIVSARYADLQGYIPGIRMKTDSEGKFKLQGLPANTELEFYSPKHSRKRESSPNMNSNDNVFELDPLAQIIGKVIDKESQEPIERFNIKIRHARDTRDGERFAEVEVSRSRRGADFDSDDGTFLLNELILDAPHDLECSAEGYGIKSISRIFARKAGEEEEIVFEMTPPEWMIIAGQVKREDGSLVQDANVHLLVSDYTDRTRSPSFHWSMVTDASYRGATRDYELVRTDSKGAFSFRLEKIENLIDLAVTGNMIGRAHLELDSLSNEEKGNLVITVVEGGAIKGTLNSSIYPQSLGVTLGKEEGGIIKAYDYGSTNFAFESLPPGPYIVCVNSNQHGRGPSAGRFVEVRAGKTEVVNLGEETLPEVEGRIIIGAEPLSRENVALVMILSEHIRPCRLVQTSEEGFFLLRNVELGDYEIVVLGDAEPTLQNLKSTKYARDILHVGSGDISRDFIFSSVIEAEK